VEASRVDGHAPRREPDRLTLDDGRIGVRAELDAHDPGTA
jgi:hypothetical protein